MKKIAFINQRYGLEVNGGSEYYTRLIAEHLKDIYDIEILTTKAVDHVTWDNYYMADEEHINGIMVRRFPTEKSRDINKFSILYSKLLSKTDRTYKDEMNWVNEQGPYCPKLIEYIQDNADKYDLFIFVTYLYYPACIGIREVFNKSVLIPTAHDEPPIYFGIYRDVFRNPRGIVYLTEEEKKFANYLFDNSNVPSVVTAVGVDVPEYDAKQQATAKKENYIAYVGRIEEGKGCQNLFEYFKRYKQKYSDDLKLVLVGKNAMPIPENEYIDYRGFVSEEEKFRILSGAKALVLPSQFESLSIAVLEALQIGTPILVNGRCEVLKGHILKSNAGLYYNDYYDFEYSLNYMINRDAERKVMSCNGIDYVNKYYRWDVVRKNLCGLFDSIIGNCESN